MSSTPTALVWLDPVQGPLIAEVAALAGLEIAQVGTPAGGAVETLPDARVFDDLRHAVASTDAHVVLLAADAESSPLDDAELVAQCRARGMVLCTFEPAPAALVSMRRFERHEGVEPVRVLPLLRHSSPFTDATDLVEQLGSLRTLLVHGSSGPGLGSLGARLYDAMATVHGLLGLPDRIDAAVTGAGAFRAAPSLRGLQGDCTAHLRYDGGRTAAVALSTAGPWRREALLTGEAGRLRVRDDAVELTDREGTILDCNEPGAPSEIAAILAERIQRLLDPHVPAPPPIDRASILAMCEAALLSAHTGHPEHPQTLLRMGGAG